MSTVQQHAHCAFNNNNNNKNNYNNNNKEEEEENKNEKKSDWYTVWADLIARDRTRLLVKHSNSACTCPVNICL